MHPTENSNIYIETLCVQDLKPDPKNARMHSKKQIDVLARAIHSLGFNNPVLIDKNNVIIAGHGRLEAAKKLELITVPVIRLEHLTPEQVRAYRIADNRIAELAEWDENALRIELQDLSLLDLDFDLTITGFEIAEIDLMIMPADTEAIPEEPHLPIDTREPVITKPGDLWILGDHKIFCGNSLDAESYAILLVDKKADLVFTDPPYNVPIHGHVLTRNNGQHEEFAMASGEMSTAEFQHFLKTVAYLLVKSTKDGSIHYICMDWRHIYDLLHACGPCYAGLKNICIWNKNNGGMGSLYRSKHEMIAVFKNGTAPHCNNVELGKHGRYRTNVWDYVGQNSPHEGRMEELAMHPTVKPVAMIADAIYDCSHRGDLVLDPFGGSGSTLIAAERTGRRARLLELEPRYVDITIKRWQKLTGKTAVHSKSGGSFAQLSEIRGPVCYV